MNVRIDTLTGVHLLHGQRKTDDRGEFRKVVTATLLRDAGIDTHIEEVVTTTNLSTGTVRGLHYQAHPHQQSKTIWVTSGSLFDVLVDVRPDSPTYGSWMAVTLSAADDFTLHVPVGIAHGYQTLEDQTSLAYLLGGAYAPTHARTLAWDDPSLDIAWPRDVSNLSDNDRGGDPWPPSL